MAETGDAHAQDGDRDAAGYRVAGARLHAYRVRGLDRGAVVLWVGGADDEPDRVFTLPKGALRRVPVFVTARQTRTYLRRHGRRPAAFEVGTLELARVQRWLDAPARRKVPAGAVLETWNFVEDLARGLDAPHLLPRQGALHDAAYDKLFGGEPAAWTPAERRAVVELLTAGVQLWNTCPVVAAPR